MLSEVVDTTLSRIQQFEGKRIVMLYSGGKESSVLSKLIDIGGFKIPKVSYYHDLMYSFCIEELKEVDTELHFDPNINLDWLSKNRRFLFIANSRDTERFNLITVRKFWEEYYRKHRLDLVVGGHRRADRTVCGKDGLRTGRNNTYLLYSPLYDWSTDTLKDFITSYGVQISRFYSQTDDSFSKGQCSSNEEPNAEMIRLREPLMYDRYKTKGLC